MSRNPLAPTDGTLPTPEAIDTAWRLHRHHANDHAYVLMDPNGTVLSWTGAAAKILGYAEDEMVGRPIEAIFTEEDVARGLALHERQVALSGARSEDDRWHRRRDGTLIWVTGSMEAVRTEAGEVIALTKVMRDRTDLRAQLESLTGRVEALTAEASEQAAFNATLAHELRNALAPLTSATRLLQRPGLDEQGQFAAGVLGRQLVLLQRMVDDLSDAASEGRSDLPLQYGTFDLNELVREVASPFRHGADGLSGKVSVLMPGDAVQIEADRARLQQCVYNLLDNAMKYTPGDGRIWVKLSVEADHAVLRIEDEGIGIAGEFLPRVFEMFTREQASPAPGMGVGLGLVRQIVAAHGGFTEVRSEGRGRGSEFSIRLPLRLAAA